MLIHDNCNSPGLISAEELTWGTLITTPWELSLGPLHTREWEPVTVALQELSLVEKAEPVQVHFTLRSRDQRSTCMQDDGCKVDMDSYMESKWIVSHGHLDCFQKPPLGGTPNRKPGDHGTPNAHNRWFILFYHVWGPAWIDIHWNRICLRARSHMASHSTRESVTTLHDVGGVLERPLDTFFWALTMSWSRLLACVWSDP